MLLRSITMNNSIGNSPKRHHQTGKPHKDFPLTRHPSGRWCKKIKGKLHYFGKINDPQAALEKWLAEKDALLAGQEPRRKVEDITLRELANGFLTYKQELVVSGELSDRTFTEYHATCARLLKSFGKGRAVADLVIDDFERLRAEIAKQWGPIRLGNEIQRVRSVFKFAYDSDLIDKPVRFGPGFKRPSLKTLRKPRAEKGQRMFEAKDLHAILDAAAHQLRTIVLLGVDCGFGNEDVATLRIEAIDLAGGWGMHPRPKTGVERRCKLWPETVKAIQEVLNDRKPPTDEAYANILFITKYGRPWANGSYEIAVTHEMDKFLRTLKVKRSGMSFNTLRHTHRTIADGSRDQKACDYIMGHYDTSMAGHYIERIDDERLTAVAEHVRTWLFGKAEKQARKGKK
jgi:integrase